ncbi:MAG TPA: metallophosphoesterase, partial [Thermoanaerobaculia bacterium]|nr:metallophosphoesterase [Thermoanaerobaculia bacterium]
HALPFYSEGRPDQGGIARAIGYLARQKRGGALIFSGGDMINRGAPAWSDRYGCAEWSWLNGIADAMAFGNHEADYGYQEFLRCRDALTYPILSANTAGFPPYAVLAVNGVRLGVFAVAGRDFGSLVRLPGLRFGDPVAAARETVRRLREEEKAGAVVLIGHQHAAADFELARSVPGIDLILGSHGHLKQELMRIPGTETWFISPYQYLTYISRVELTFEGGKLARVAGELVPVDRRMPRDRRIAARVAAMQRALERDPEYRHLFVPFATLQRPMAIDELGRRTVELMRKAAGSGIALSTASSFRRALPAGPIDLETLRGALPYDNEIVVAELPAARARELLAYARSRQGDAFAYAAGAVSGDVTTVATTDYLARVAAGYRDFFSGAEVRKSGLRVRDELRKRLADGSLPP